MINIRQMVFGRVAAHIAGNKILYILLSGSLLMGVTIGAILADFLDASQSAGLTGYMENFFSAYGLQSIDNTQVFFASLYNSAELLLLVWVFGIFIIGIPLVMLEVGLRGFKVGFSVAFLIKAYGFKGLLFSAGTILPSGIIFIPMLIAYSVVSSNFGATLHYLRKNRLDNFRTKKALFTKHVIMLVAALALTAVCSGIDAWVVPIIVKPICSM